MAPDGEIISLGGSVARGGQGAIYDVGNINDVVMPHRHEGRTSPLSCIRTYREPIRATVMLFECALPVFFFNGS